ncbi:hypothetical protein QQ008_15375 [Fulvivirgaceae bacterium BMA10]|uniref:Uncharacterized protein n=1 Tax=Splendidivirga corallicola TaxID=3051826 RepID=A0ABT8KRD8_9BACT|nr:hypothetical protein [Fulvivirgaceae bacterium BMA10]
MKNFIAGVKYAGIFMVIVSIMGALYGLISGVVFGPAIFAITIVGVFVSMNFAVAIASLVPYLLLVVSKRKARLLARYIALSIGFFIVFFPVFLFHYFSPWVLF